jgi:26S proteasome regulatory subunit N8
MSNPGGDALLSEPGRVYTEVIVHPLVLLSAVDHHYRVAREQAKKRVVGVLLGEVKDGRVDVTNSFALPFEEDGRDPDIFFCDHDYLESMYYMHKKISARERIVGFYSTAAKIKPADLHLDALFRRLTYVHPDPILTLIDVRPDIEGLPVQAYQTVETVVDGKENVRNFVHIACEVGAYEAEEVGVEHLLRDINDPSVSSTAADIRQKLVGLKGLAATLGEVSSYLESVLAGKLPPNKDILYHIQTLFATLPNVRTSALSSALFETSNDAHLVMYVSSLTRSVLALHDLVNNKIKYKDDEDSDKKDKVKEEENKDTKKEVKEGKDSKEEPKK